jgi:hypothetical protein
MGGLSDLSSTRAIGRRAATTRRAAAEVGEDRLIAALDEWDEARRLARDRSGETAAQERHEQLYDERCDACERVAAMRARTLSGMLAKLAFISPDFDADEVLEFGTADMGTFEKILVSVAVDFKLGVDGVQQRAV